MDNETLVKSIKQLCNKNNITVSQLEKELGFSPSLISRWVKNSPSLDKVIDIADYFHESLDVVVGHKLAHSENQTMKFVNSVYEKTKSKGMIWYVYDEVHPLIYDNVYLFKDITYKGWTKEFYYSKYENGYFILLIFYLKINYEITDTALSLYIQPDQESIPVLQCEGEDILGSLWRYIRPQFYGTLDEIKAEEFKNAFVMNQSLTNSSDVLSGGLNNYPDTEILSKVANDPAVQQLIELYNKPEFQKIQQVLASPDFQAAVKAANRIQKQLDKK